MGGDTFNSSRSKETEVKDESNHGNIIKIKQKLYSLFRETQSFFGEGFSPVLKLLPVREFNYYVTIFSVGLVIFMETP